MNDLPEGSGFPDLAVLRLVKAHLTTVVETAYSLNLSEVARF